MDVFLRGGTKRSVGAMGGLRWEACGALPQRLGRGLYHQRRFAQLTVSGFRLTGSIWFGCVEACHRGCV